MYFGDFADREDVLKNFNIDKLNGVILFAGYDYEDYSGSADVIFVEKGKLYHVEGSHCSCYGLEDQWNPVELPIEAIQHLCEKGYGPLNRYKDHILEALRVIQDMGLDQCSTENAAFALRLLYK
jgi:hypothetical protein